MGMEVRAVSTVTEVDGPIVADMSSLVVTSDNGSYLLNNGNVWTLLEINGNVMVTISASLAPAEEDFPWWVVILITVMMVSAAALIWNLAVRHPSAENLHVNRNTNVAAEDAAAPEGIEKENREESEQ